LTIGRLARKFYTEREAEFGDEYDEVDAREEFEEFILESEFPWVYRTESGKGVIEAAMELSHRDFKPWIEEAAIDFGLLEAPEQDEPGGESGTIDLSGGTEAGDDDGAPAAPVAPTTSKGEELSAKETVDKWGDIAAEVEGGKFTFNSDIEWERQLADDLRLSDEQAIHAFNWMVDVGLLS